MALGEERIHHGLKERDEDQDEDGVECLHLVRLNHKVPSNMTVHFGGLQGPPGSLEEWEGKREK